MVVMARSFFESESPARFFKVVLESDLREEKLSIPPKFVGKHGTMLSDSMNLEVPNGDVWEVRLEKIGGVCVHQGIDGAYATVAMSRKMKPQKRGRLI